MFGQTSLFDICTKVPEVVVGKTVRQTVQEEDVMSYLKRQDRILTLAREVEHSGRRYTEPEGIMAALYKAAIGIHPTDDNGYKALFKKLVSTIVSYYKPKIKKFIESNGQDDSGLIQEMFEGYEFDECPIVLTRGSNHYVNTIVKKNSTGMILFDTFERTMLNGGLEDVRAALSDGGFKSRYTRSVWAYGYGYTKHINLDELAPEILALQLRKIVCRNDDSSELVRKLIEGEYARRLPQSFLCEKPYRILYDRERIDGRILMGLFERSGLRCVDGYDVPECSMYPESVTIYPRLALGVLGGIKKLKEWSGYNWLSNGDGAILARCIEVLARESETEKEYRRYLKEVSHTARVFEDKKNIPEKTVAKMRDSKFNDYFGYIEFDESVDLSLVDEIYKEFCAVNARFFGGYANDSVMLRFRLLGRHHALGLYFPTLKCLCVDVRSPSSFIHEYMHMWDHEHGELSRKFEFIKIRERYESLLRKKMDENKAFAGSLKGKYDLKYYLTPTEVFARCGEIYFSRIYGVRNSLVDDVKSEVYPTDNILESLIKDYFDEVLNNKPKLPVARKTLLLAERIIGKEKEYEENLL